MKSSTKIIAYVLGNDIVKDDASAIKLIPFLDKQFPQYHFLRYDPTEDLSTNTHHLIFIDTVRGIQNVTLYKNLLLFQNSPKNSVHDYDLLLHLQIMLKLKKIKKLRIIGIPTSGNIKEMKKQLKKIFTSSEL